MTNIKEMERKLLNVLDENNNLHIEVNYLKKITNNAIRDGENYRSENERLSKEVVEIIRVHNHMREKLLVENERLRGDYLLLVSGFERRLNEIKNEFDKINLRNK